MQKTVVLAEDDEGIIQVVKMILESEGYAILTAKNEKEVHAILRSHQPQLLLLDVSLGGSDGGKLAKALKQNSATKSLPIIIASANSETKEIAKASGAEGFLLKPFEIETLLSIVKKHSSPLS